MNGDHLIVWTEKKEHIHSIERHYLLGYLYLKLGNL